MKIRAAALAFALAVSPLLAQIRGPCPPAATGCDEILDYGRELACSDGSGFYGCTVSGWVAERMFTVLQASQASAAGYATSGNSLLGFLTGSITADCYIKQTGSITDPAFQCAHVSGYVQPAGSCTTFALMRWNDTGIQCQALNSAVDLSDSGFVTPRTTNAQDLGSATLKWRDLHLSRDVVLRDTSAAFDATLRFTSSPVLTANRTLTVNMGDADQTVVTTTGTLTLTNKTLTAPTIGDLTNAQHGHTGVSSGGTLWNTGSASLDFAGGIASGCEDLTLTVTGAATGKPTLLGAPDGSVVASAQFSAWVSAADTVKVRM